MAISGGSRNGERLSRFLQSQAGKEMELDHVGRLRILGGKLGQGLIDGKYGSWVEDWWLRVILKVDPLSAAPTAEATLAAGTFDHDPPHGFGGGSEEVAAAVEVLSLLDIDKPDIGVVNKCSGLQRLSWPFVRELCRGELS